MQNRKKYSRVLLFLILLTAMLAGVSAPVTGGQSVSAAPLRANVRDVIISEVAWGGTIASTSDEWIELYNTTGSDITFGNTWTLSDGGDININLTGTIPAGGYYLLEKTDDNVVSSPADEIYTGSLSNNGEVLTLKDDTSTVIDTANSSCNLCWYAGSTDPYFYSMQRVGAADTATSWASSHDALIPGEVDQNNNPVNGTPGTSEIDLSLTVSVDKPTPNVGDNVVFTVTVTNNNSIFTATTVMVHDAFPAGLIYVSNDGGLAYAQNSGLADWTIPTLAGGQSAVLKITATVPALGAYKNAAEIISFDQYDPDSIPGNNSVDEDDDDFAKTVPLGTPALTISNTVNNATPNVGTNVVFTITITNPSTNPYPATNASVAALLLPANAFTYISYSSTIPTATYDGNTGIWDVNSLAVGASATLKLTAKVITTNPPPFTATLSADQFGYVSSTVTINAPLIGEADLYIDTVDTVDASGIKIVKSTIADQVGLRLVLRNKGPDKATNVQVRDLLPAGLTFVSSATTNGTYNNTTGIWAMNEVASGAAPTLTINVKVDVDGTSTKNFAEVWQSDQFDPTSVPGNGEQGEDDEAVLEVPISDLRLTQKVDISGTNAVFSITVSNSGPDDATGVQVSNKLPTLTSAYTFVSNGVTPGIPSDYNSSSGIWTVGDLANGASATLTITTTVSSSLLVNWAEVYAVDQVDPDSVPKNNSKIEDDDASAPSADLYVSQTVNAPPNPDIGSNVVFTITAGNSGVAGSTNVQVKDLLPSGLTYVSYSSLVGTYTSSTGIWGVGTLANGTSQTLTITAKVSANGIRTNWAEIWKSDESDPDSTPGNSSTTEDDDASASYTSYRSIVINEVAWAGTIASPSDEWIELYNPSNAAINISGWILKSSSGGLDIKLTGTIKAGDYFLLERDDNFTVSDVAADQIYTGNLPDTGDTLFLCNDDPCSVNPPTNFIDSANLEGFSATANLWPKGSSSSPFGSMERQGTSSENDSVWATNIGNPKNGLDANSNAIYGTPRKANSTGSAVASTPTAIAPTRQPPVGRPIINEFLPRPGFDWNLDGKVDVFDEFIEIKNIGNADISLSGWSLDDEENLGSDPFTLPSVTLKVGERMIFYGLQTNILLGDGGDTVRLISSSGKIYDAYTYKIAKVEDASVCRLPDGNGSWYEDCVPTPGLTNTRQGTVPSMPGGGYQSPVCDLPDTLPADFLFAECRGYGANIWHSFYWDETGVQGDQRIPDDMSRWESFVE